MTQNRNCCPPSVPITLHNYIKIIVSEWYNPVLVTSLLQGFHVMPIFKKNTQRTGDKWQRIPDALHYYDNFKTIKCSRLLNFKYLFAIKIHVTTAVCTILFCHIREYVICRTKISYLILSSTSLMSSLFDPCNSYLQKCPEVTRSASKVYSE